MTSMEKLDHLFFCEIVMDERATPVVIMVGVWVGVGGAWGHRDNHKGKRGDTEGHEGSTCLKNVEVLIGRYEQPRGVLEALVGVKFQAALEGRQPIGKTHKRKIPTY